MFLQWQPKYEINQPVSFVSVPKTTVEEERKKKERTQRKLGREWRESLLVGLCDWGVASSSGDGDLSSCRQCVLFSVTLGHVSCAQRLGPECLSELRKEADSELNMLRPKQSSAISLVDLVPMEYLVLQIQTFGVQPCRWNLQDM